MKASLDSQVLHLCTNVFSWFSKWSGPAQEENHHYDQPPYICEDSKLLVHALQKWFKGVYGPFGQSNMRHTLIFWPHEPGRNQV
jgi:hypothetical protein